MIELNKVYLGNAVEVLRTFPDESIDCCVTSPPYFGLRDYGSNGQIGLEQTPEAYIAKLVEVFSEVRRCLKKDGTLWVNIGDSYATGTTAGRQQSKNPGVGANRPEAQNSVPPPCRHTIRMQDKGFNRHSVDAGLRSPCRWLVFATGYYLGQT